ncbi:hypothetical protein BKA63DRAFT_558159 [Paraphoma chrysanthemicola]|nr:hypothetical protein BKA63DRAFT_558159 [Paraphoma chrysanthemicola]
MADRTTPEDRQQAVLLDRVNSANAVHLKEQSWFVLGVPGIFFGDWLIMHSLNVLNTEMAHLQQRIQGAKDKVKVAKEVTMTAIGDRSKYVCRLLADAIHGKLPRELRDMIYNLLWTKDLEKYNHLTNERPWRATEVLEEDLESDPEGWCSEYGFPVNQREKALDIYPQLHFVDSEFMGDEMPRESAE